MVGLESGGDDSNSSGSDEMSMEKDRIVQLVVAAGRFGRTVTRVLGSKHASFVWRILGTLDADGARRMTHLAINEGVSQGAMTTNMQRLENLGFVVRMPDPEDGRATLVRITPLGRTELRAHRERVSETLFPYFAQLTCLELAAVDRVIEAMNEMSAASVDEK